MPFDVAMKLYTPTTTMVKGVAKKVWDEGVVFNGSLRTFGGTENFSNDVYTVFDTATVDTWYDPVFKADCRVEILETGEIYDIISRPEDIGMRHQFCQFKMQKAGGKA